MVTFTELRTRTYGALSLSSSDVATGIVDEWVKRAIADVYEKVQHVPQLIEAFRSIQAKADAVVSSVHLIDWPSSCMRILGGALNGNTVAKICRESDLIPNDQYNAPRVSSPWLRVVSVGNASYLETIPRQFAMRQATLYFLQIPDATDSFGEEVCDAIVYCAAKIGAMEQSDLQIKLPIMTTLYEKTLAQLGVKA